MNSLGDAGRKLIQQFEKLCCRAYQDERGIWTIGWGHTGRDVIPGLVCTPEQAGIWFTQDTQTAVNAVNRSVSAPLTQNQFDALVSFTFNVGQGAEEHSTLCRLVNAERYSAAAAEFDKWIYSGGHVSAGLVDRRAAEKALFLQP
jgi:lysozyme